ncbi:MAG: hypothetical protein ABIN36_01080 [Ferruginibacter sp.]
MKIKILFLIFFASVSILFSCAKKSVPRNTTETSTAKRSTTSKTKTPVPKVIVVNDAVAQKTVDGRYYYDLNGKRYYRNNKDGKYYLFNKSMYNNPEFKPQP